MMKYRNKDSLLVLKLTNCKKCYLYQAELKEDTPRILKYIRWITNKLANNAQHAPKDVAIETKKNKKNK